MRTRSKETTVVPGRGGGRGLVQRGGQSRPGCLGSREKRGGGRGQIMADLMLRCHNQNGS